MRFLFLFPVPISLCEYSSYSLWQSREKIVNACQTHATPANSLNLRQALTDFSSGRIDFNDSLLADICLQRQYKLLTHDSDFQFGGIDVLTLNRKLLQACR